MQDCSLAERIDQDHSPPRVTTKQKFAIMKFPNAFATFSLSAILLLNGNVASHAQDEAVQNDVAKEDQDARFVRVFRNEDGSRTVFRRSPDDKTLTKKTFMADGKLALMTVYKMDERANPRSCKIFDSTEAELFRVSYGYDRVTRRLVEERMFDSRVKRLDPNDATKQMPVRIFVYSYDAQGNQSKPFAITLLAGKTAEELFGKNKDAFHNKGTFDKNPFEAEMKKRAGVQPEAGQQ